MPHALLRKQQSLAPHVKILADVLVKHAAPLGDLSIEIAARDTAERGLADALIVSGTGTGDAANVDDVRRVRSACPGSDHPARQRRDRSQCDRAIWNSPMA